MQTKRQDCGDAQNLVNGIERIAVHHDGEEHQEKEAVEADPQKPQPPGILRQESLHHEILTFCPSS